MSIQVQGNSGVIAEVESNTRALRTVLRPTDFGSLGVYRLGMMTGVMAAGLGANAEIFQFRWTSGSSLALIRLCRISAGSIAAFAAGVAGFEMVVARSWSADGSGGTAATLSGNNNKLRTSMGTTGIGAVRIASTAALTAGTKSLDSQGMGNAVGSVTATAGIPVIPPSDLYNPDTESEYPLVLSQNEGFVIRATVPATGTWTAGVTIKWMELAAY